MKKERREFKRVEYKDVFIAGDGTEFSSEDECRKYEESAKYAVKQLIKGVPQQATFGIGQDFLSSFGYEDNIRAFKIRNADDVDAINRWMKITFNLDNSANDGVSVDHIGTIQLFETYAYDEGIWHIGSVDEMKEMFCKEVDGWVSKLAEKTSEDENA